MTKIEKSFWLLHPRIAKKVQNIKAKPEVYISIDDENFPYKGVKGKGTVTIIEDPKKTVPHGEKIGMKYLGTLDHPIVKMILHSAQQGNHVVIEVSPKFFSTWDFAKM
jgi:general stress protein 26